jgi:antitoxin MazE
MQTTIIKWSNSQEIRIPKTFLQEIQIAESDPIDVILEKEKIIIKKSNVKKHKTTEERLLEFYGTDFDKNHTPQKEIDWGTPVGKEIW